MNNKVIGYGSIALAVILLFAFVFIGSQVHEAKKNAQSGSLVYNGITLNDSTVYLPDGSCVALAHGMNITVNPCNAYTFSGRNIEQDVEFKWQGNNTLNVTWIFVYDGQLDSGGMNLLRNVSFSEQQNVSTNAWANNFQVTNVTGFTNLGTPNESSCQFGNANNTQMYSVTRNQNGTAFSQVYCFTNSTNLGGGTYKLQGNYWQWGMQQVSGFRNEWRSVTNQIQYLGYGILNGSDNRSYYRVQNVEFNPGQSYKTQWLYSPVANSTSGKWHIVGFPTNVGLTQALATNQYIYMDPSWSPGFGVGLKNYWGFDEGSGTVGYDNASWNNFTINSPATFRASSASCVHNNCLHATTATENATGVILQGDNSGAYTISFWLKPAPWANYNAILWNANNGGQPFSDGEFGIIYGGSGTSIEMRTGNTNGPDNTPPLNDNAWNHVVFKMTNGNPIQLWVNGVNAYNSSSQTYTSFINQNLMIFGATGAVGWGNGISNTYIDELAIWNRSLTNNEVLDLYNNGTGLFFTGSPPSTGVATTLLSPSTSYITSSNTINFTVNSTITAGVANLTNVTLYVWNASNDLNYSEFRTISGASYNTTNWGVLFGEGSYKWNALSSATPNATAWGASNFTFTIDQTGPVLNFTSPINGTIYPTLSVPYNVSYYHTIIENNPASCWYNNETANVSLANCGSNFSILWGAGYHTVTLYANDTAGNIAVPVQDTVLINYIVPNLTFTSPVVEYQPFNATFNITANLINSAAANLTYNGSIYSMNLTTSNSTFASFRINGTAPGNLSANQIIPLLVNYTVNGDPYSFGPRNQTVLAITPIVVSTSCNDKAMIFSAQDEQNLTALNISIDYNIKYGIGNNNTLKTVFGSLTNIGQFFVCINSTVSNAYVVGSGEIDYQSAAGGYVLRRYYIFEDHVLTNATENITLFDLPNSAATSFLVEAKDQTLSPYVQKFLGLLRWYPQLNTYNLVEMAQTDETGRSIMRVKTEDVDYRVALWDVNGTLIKLNDPTRFACLTQPCTYSFTVFPSDQDFTSITGIQQSLTFNETSSKFSFIWNDPSQRTQTMNMTIYRETGLSIGQVCESIGTGATGAIQSCDLSGYTGQFRAVIYRTASPALPINQLVWNIGQAISTVAARMGLFISAILAIAGFFIGIFNPIIGIIMQIVSLVPSLYLGSITQSVIIGAAIMGVVVIHFMRRIFS